MLRGDLEGEDLDRYVEERVMTTTMDRAVAWARGNSFFPLTFGLACCAIEQIHIVASRMDIARFGWEAFRASRAVGPDHPLGAGIDQDGARDPADLRPDARSQVGHIDGSVLLVDGRLQQLRPRAGGQVPADRCPCSGVRRAPRRWLTEFSGFAPRFRGTRRPDGASATRPRRGNRGDSPRATTRQTKSPSINVLSPGGHRQELPDATGVGARPPSELREAHTRLDP